MIVREITPRSRAAVGALTLALLGSGALACDRGATAPEPSPPPPVERWVEVRASDRPATVEASARLVGVSSDVAVIAPAFAARVVRVHVQSGDRVAANAPIVDILMPSVLEAAARLVAAERKLETYGQRKAQLEALGREGLVRAADLAEVESQLTEAGAERMVARALLASAQLSDEAAHGLARSNGVLSLRAPRAGVVTDVHPSVGGQVEAGTPLARVLSGSTPRIEARLPRGISESARFTFVGSGARVAAKLLNIAPTVDPRDGTRTAWFEPERTEGAPPLVPGETGALVIEVEPDREVLVVPLSALSRSAEGTSVRLRDEGGSRSVRVEVLSTLGRDALVRGALQVGQQIALAAGGGE